MNAIESLFNEAFGNWDLRLPADAIESRSAGRIVNAGWTIWYTFGSEQGREYLSGAYSPSTREWKIIETPARWNATKAKKFANRGLTVA